MTLAPLTVSDTAPTAGAAPLFGANLSVSLIEDLAARGWAHAPGALEPDLARALRAEALAMAADGALAEARIGRGEAERRDRAVRRTAIAWMDGRSPAQRAFLDGCEAMRTAINRALFAGLFEFEAHYAVYPPGGFYARHLDAFAPPPVAAGPNAVMGRTAARSRVVSMVVYLNEGWTPDDGGELAVWERFTRAPDGRADLRALDGVPPAGVIAPEMGSVALMLSEAIPHEVRPAAATRCAIAGWWRVNASIGGVVDPAR